MSVLDTPRIYFSGEMVWDPIVTNNYQEFYDEIACDPAPAADPVADFRARAIAAVDPRNWNPHGTHRSSFLAQVSGVDTGNGLDTSDAFVGAPANFLGMLVDAEPYGTISSQLFFDTMQFGISGGSRVTCPRTFRVMSRYVNFSRNAFNSCKAGIASVIWQTSIPKTTGLQLDTHDSAGLQALSEALADDDVLGLTVRWNTYRTIYYDDPDIRVNSGGALSAAAQALMAKLNVPNSFQPNPARSLMVGVIGVWRQGEPACEPGDRALLSQLPEETVGTAFARYSANRLTIDLGNSIPEIDADCTKQDFGDLSVVALAPDGSVASVLGTLPYTGYNREAYLATSGVVEIPLDPAAAEEAAGAPLQIRSGNSVYLSEAPLRAAPTVDQNIYLDEGGPSAGATLQVLLLGAPAMAGIPVTRYLWVAATKQMTALDTEQSDANGIVSFPVSPAGQGDITSYLFAAGSDAPAPAQLDPQLTPYIYVRTLPADAAIGALEPTWANVYANVLSNWKAMAPCMDNWLDLADPAQVYAYRAVLKALTDPAAFEAYRFMPVTRDMTTGERGLLYKFLDGPPPAAGSAFLAEAPGQPELPNIARLSRAMRGG